MISIVELAKLLKDDESGQDLIEYALVASLIGLATVSAMQSLASTIASSLSSLGTTLTSNT